MKYTLAILVVALLSSLKPIAGQQPAAGAAAPETFEVASIRQNTSGSRNSVLADYKGEQFRVTNASVTDIIGWAYGMDYFYVAKFAAMEGMPRWAGDRYDIVAKTAGRVAQPAGARQPRPVIGPLNVMLQSLLAERFRLVVHWETRQRPGYALVLAARDGRLGPKIHSSDVNCDVYKAAYRAALAAGQPAPEVPGWRGRACDVRGRSIGPMTEVLISAKPIQALADFLTLWGGQPFTDRTGLTGLFDIELTYSPAPLSAAPVPQEGKSQGVATQLAASDPDGGPSLADALRDQLGLALEPQRAPVEVLVIDSVQRPTEN